MKKGKRFTAMLLCGCITALTMPVLPQPVSADVLRGDVSGDGKLTSDDVYMLYDMLAQPDAPYTAACDYNGDGVINGKDLTLLKRYMMFEYQDEPETAVMMVYMCGSDLETEAAEATEDIYEMLEADFSAGGLTIVAMTGGAQAWHEEAITADQNYYVTIDSEGGFADTVDGTLHHMSNPETLEMFIRDTAAAYPADHYGLIMWDHGSGPIYGLCYDELSENSLYLEGMCSALKNAGVHFDWIGFDCCLMGSAETAFVLSPYADYMIGSEESESGFGWNYEKFPTKWCENPSMPVPDLCKMIIDDMTAVNKMYQQPSTLALYDLSQAGALMQSIYAYIDDVYKVFNERGVLYVNEQRGKCLDFGDGEFDLVDLSSLIQNIRTAHSDTVLQAMRSMVKYNRSCNISPDPCGVSLWFFENYPEDGYYLMDTMLGGLGFDSNYIAQMEAMSKVALEIKSGSSVMDVPVRSFTDRMEALHGLNRLNGLQNLPQTARLLPAIR